jgi:hypothetical protein
MRLELVPLVVGGFLFAIGLGLVFDAWTPDDVVVRRERRRSKRTERSRGGEASIGFGIMCMGAAFIGRDTWRYSVIAVIAGAVLLLFGVLASRQFLGASITRRGALRRRDKSPSDPPDGPRRERSAKV